MSELPSFVPILLSNFYEVLQFPFNLLPFEYQAVELMVTKVQQMNDRMERKVQLLGSYEDDLVHLR